MNTRGEIVDVAAQLTPIFEYDGHFVNYYLLKCLLNANGIVVMPYIPYSRQDTGSEGSPCALKLIADFFEIFRIHDLITLDLHCKFTRDYFKCNVHIAPVSDYLDFATAYDVVASPDAGGIARVSGVVNHDRALFLKHRPVSTIMLGNLRGCSVLLIDDILDSGHTIYSALQACHKNHAFYVDCLIFTCLGDEGVVSWLKAAGLRKLFVFDCGDKTNSYLCELLPLKQKLLKMHSHLLSGLRI